jgi:hypothetical protein
LFSLLFLLQKVESTMPNIEPNFLAIAAAVVVNFFFAYAWYTPLFGRTWAKEMGLPADHQMATPQLLRGLAINLVCCFLMALVLASQIAVWTPQSWGLTVPGPSPVSQSLSAAGFTWLGFFVPVLLNTVAWEGRSWKMFAIHGGYYFLALLFAALILTHWR